MAEMTERRGFVIPTWFLSAICASFFSITVLLGGAAVSTWSKADAALSKNIEQDRRLDRLERVYADIGAIKAEVIATHDLAMNTDRKLDRLIDRDLQGAH